MIEKCVNLASRSETVGQLLFGLDRVGLEFVNRPKDENAIFSPPLFCDCLPYLFEGVQCLQARNSMIAPESENLSGSTQTLTYLFGLTSKFIKNMFIHTGIPGSASPIPPIRAPMPLLPFCCFR